MALISISKRKQAQGENLKRHVGAAGVCIHFDAVRGSLGFARNVS
jgi:hypothetical protein